MDGACSTHLARSRSGSGIAQPAEATVPTKLAHLGGRFAGDPGLCPHGTSESPTYESWVVRIGEMQSVFGWYERFRVSRNLTGVSCSMIPKHSPGLPRPARLDTAFELGSFGETELSQAQSARTALTTQALSNALGVLVDCRKWRARRPACRGLTWRCSWLVLVRALLLLMLSGCEDEQVCGTIRDADCHGPSVPRGMACVPSGSFRVTRAELDPYEPHEICVEIGRPLLVDATEITQLAWKTLSGGTNPACQQDAMRPNCVAADDFDDGPVESIDWFSALAFANARSEREGLERCYQLDGCDDPTSGWKDGRHTGCTVGVFRGLDCSGYRLPTSSEWEYFARAGTSGETYGGNLSDHHNCGVVLSGGGGIAPSTPLEDLAWFSCNSDGRTHAVGTKLPNSWGL
jgi:formylglycine-generating enzyme required for sulfatase activity